MSLITTEFSVLKLSFKLMFISYLTFIIGNIKIYQNFFIKNKFSIKK